MYSENIVNEIKERNPILDLVSSYVSLKRGSRNFMGICPFHAEKTASFCIYPDTESFYCFGCSVGGDVITFVMLVENLDYSEALEFLAQRAGIKIEEDENAAFLNSMRQKIYAINRESAKFFHKNLFDKDKSALEYMLGRGLKIETLRNFGIGFAPRNFSELCTFLRSKDYSEDELVSANVAVKKEGGEIRDRFFGRVMFPIIDIRGNVVGFGGRAIDDTNPKYLNTSDTLVYKKSLNLFALNFAKKTKERRIILTEGYMDVVSLHQAGITGAVAALGTALTNEQAKLILRHADEIVLTYDSDEAGQKATERAIEIFRGNGVLPNVVSIPKGKDPDEFIKIHGENSKIQFEKLIKDSENGIQYRINKIKKMFDLEKSDEKIKYSNEAAKIISEIESPIERDVYTSGLAFETNVHKEALAAYIASLRKKTEKHRKKMEFKFVSDRITKNSFPMSNVEELIISFLIKNPEKVSLLSPGDFSSELCRKIFDSLQNGLNFNKDFSFEENGRISKIINSHEISAEEFEMYVEMLKNEKKFNEIKNSENFEIEKAAEYIESLKKLKKV